MTQKELRLRLKKFEMSNKDPSDKLLIDVANPEYYLAEAQRSLAESKLHKDPTDCIRRTVKCLLLFDQS